MRAYFKSLNLQVPSPVVETIARMLNDDRTNRYGSMTDVITALENCRKKIDTPSQNSRRKRFAAALLISAILAGGALFLAQQKNAVPTNAVPTNAVPTNAVPTNAEMARPAAMTVPSESSAVESSADESTAEPSAASTIESSSEPGTDLQVRSNTGALSESTYSNLSALEKDKDWARLEQTVSSTLETADFLDDKDRFFLLFTRGKARHQLGDTKRALDDLSAAITLRENSPSSEDDDPDYRPYLNRAEIYYELGAGGDRSNYDLAERDLQSVQEIDYLLTDGERLGNHPDDLFAYLSMSAFLQLCVYQRYDLDYSWEYLQNLLDLNDPRTDLAWIEECRPFDNTDAAQRKKEFWNRMAKIKTDRSDFYLHMGRLARCWGDGDVAFEVWSAFLRRNPDPKKTEKALEQIRVEYNELLTKKSVSDNATHSNDSDR